MLALRAFLLASALAGDSSAVDLKQLDALVVEHVAPLAAAVKQAAAASVQAEITVTDLADRGLAVPDYREAGVTLKGFGVPRGGSSGSPSFDVVTRQYWWE